MPDYPAQPSQPAYCETGRLYLWRTSGLGYIRASRQAQVVLAENYVGLPLAYAFVHPNATRA